MKDGSGRLLMASHRALSSIPGEAATRLPWPTPLFLLVAMTLLGADVSVASGGGSWWDLGAVIFVCMSLVLGRHGFRWAMTAYLAGLLVEVFLRPQDAALGAWVPILVTADWSARRSMRKTLLVLFTGLTVSLWTSRRAGSVQDWLITIIFWCILYCGAAVLGRMLNRREAAVVDAQAERLAAQRVEIAGELHDTVAHEVTMLVLTAERAMADPRSAQDHLASIARAGRLVNEQLRQMMSLLDLESSRAILDLDTVLLDIRRQFVEAGFPMNVSFTGSLQELPPSVSECFARVAREAGNNILHHGDPSTPASLVVHVQEGRIDLLAVNDIAAAARNTHQGLGLSGMRQRVEAIGGTFSIQQDATSWTIRAMAPLVPARNPQSTGA